MCSEAARVVRLLSQLARQRPCAVVATLHQPSSVVLALVLAHAEERRARGGYVVAPYELVCSTVNPALLWSTSNDARARSTRARPPRPLTTRALTANRETRSAIFAALDDVLLVAPGGRVAFCGDTRAALAFAERCGHKCPRACVNPAEVRMNDRLPPRSRARGARRSTMPPTARPGKAAIIDISYLPSRPRGLREERGPGHSTATARSREAAIASSSRVAMCRDSSGSDRPTNRGNRDSTPSP